MITKLEAVNEILEGIGDPHVTALDTNGASDEGEAELVLDRETRRVQETGPGPLGGWWFNTQRKVTLVHPSHSLACVTKTGTFTFGETITGGTSGATAILSWYDTTQTTGTYTLYVHTAVGTFTAAETLTGSTSTATILFGTTTAITEGPIGVKPDTLSIRSFVPDRLAPGAPDHRILIQQGDRLLDSQDQTFNFDSDVVVDRVIQDSFLNLPNIVADYVIRAAAVAYQQWKKRGTIDNSMLQQRAALAKARAFKEHSRVAKTNVLDTTQIHRTLGNRRPLESFGINPHN